MDSAPKKRRIPTVGRIAHYVSYGSPIRPDGTQKFASECRAAVVTAVHDEETVTLCVLNPTGIFFHPCVLDDTGQLGGTWHWPERT